MMSIVNERNDVFTWIKVPHLPYEQQIEVFLAVLQKPIADTRMRLDGSDEEFPYDICIHRGPT